MLCSSGKRTNTTSNYSSKPNRKTWTPFLQRRYSGYPWRVGFTDEYYAVKLSSTISQTDISSQIQDYVGKRITGSTSGVIAEVIQAVAATTDDPITLYVKYVATGDDVTSTVFTDGELISADGIVGSFGADVESAQLEASDATATGSSANIEEGVYFIRGHFVRVAQQRLILDKYTNKPSYRVGLSITETLETPEEDGSLLDNAQGSSNVNARELSPSKVFSNPRQTFSYIY